MSSSTSLLDAIMSALNVSEALKNEVISRSTFCDQNSQLSKHYRDRHGLGVGKGDALTRLENLPRHKMEGSLIHAWFKLQPPTPYTSSLWDVLEMLSKGDHLVYLRQALDLARKSPPGPTNFRVGAILVSDPQSQGSTPAILSTGYTLELPGNTHAEECAIAKLAAQHKIAEIQLHTILTQEMNATLYTTLEPCGKRLSGSLPCVHRLIATRDTSSTGQDSRNSKRGIRKVIFGAKEPGTFVKDNESCRMMDEAGLEWEYVGDLQDEILNVAKEGHNIARNKETNVDDIDEEERRRQEQIPRNSKKRMMEL
jgi:pyrimidine deaminase RibD-like protein